MSRPPRVALPSYTCPDIDRIIDLLEELRTDNDALRQWAEYWEGETDSLRDELSTVERTLENANSVLTDRVAELESELRDMHVRLAEFTTLE